MIHRRTKTGEQKHHDFPDTSSPPANNPDTPLKPATSHAPPPPNPPPISESTASEHAAELRKFYLKQLRKPPAKPHEPKYKPWGAFDWTLPANPRWKQRMGESLCIIDLDNRPFNESGELFGPEPMSWADPPKVHGISLGILNHWLYGTATPRRMLGTLNR